MRRPRVIPPRAPTRLPASVAAVLATATVGLGALAAVRLSDADAATTAGDAAGRPAAPFHDPGARRAGPRGLAESVRRLRAAVVAELDGETPGAGHDDVRDALPPAALRRVDPRRPAPAAERVTVRVPRRAAPAYTVGVPWWADSAHWGADVVRWTERAGDEAVAEAGDTLTVAAPALPAALPEALRRRGVRWHAEGTAALAGRTGAGDARVLALRPGAATVTALTPAGVVRTPVRVRPAVRGRVYGVDADGRVRGLAARVVLRRAGLADTALLTDAAGRFRAPLPDGWGGDADVQVVPLDGAHDDVSLARVPADELHTLGVVLPPTRWTIAAGAYAGAAVPVHAARARGFWRAAPSGRPVGWAGDAPRGVAFEGARVDTASFWAAARGLGATWGRPLFRPVGGDEAPEVVVAVTPGLRAAGETTLSYDGSGQVAGARVEFRTPALAADARVVTHELLHALGFGHARGWVSAVGLAGGAGPAAATPEDVAHGQLLEAVRRAAREAEQEYGAARGWAGGRP